jgi:TetR/AcrR family transcriptional repressor of nem operon
MVTKGRPKTFKNADVLSKAMELFWEKGYEATSLAELLDNMGISKQSMYNTFGNKHDLFIQCLELYIASRHEFLEELLFSEKHAETKLDHMIHLMTEMATDDTKGCFVSFMIQEMAQRDEKVKSLLDNNYSKNFELLKDFFQMSMDKKEISSTMSSQDLADLYDSILLSVSSLCKLSNRQDQIKNIFRIFKKSITFNP